METLKQPPASIMQIGVVYPPANCPTPHDTAPTGCCRADPRHMKRRMLS